MRKKFSLRHSITINKDASNGTSDPSWVPVATVLADKRGLVGRTYYQAAADHAENDIIYTIRYRNDIKAKMQIIDGEKTMNIKAPPVDFEGNKMWLELHAEEVMLNGG